MIGMHAHRARQVQQEGLALTIGGGPLLGGVVGALSNFVTELRMSTERRPY